jgi:hypothetical protein
MGSVGSVCAPFSDRCRRHSPALKSFKRPQSVEKGCAKALKRDKTGNLVR